MLKTYYLYIMASRSKRLYVGVTLAEPMAAIKREKQIKGWLRKRKMELIEGLNPDWKDLSGGWYAASL